MGEGEEEGEGLGGEMFDLGIVNTEDFQEFGNDNGCGKHREWVISSCWRERCFGMFDIFSDPR